VFFSGALRQSKTASRNGGSIGKHLRWFKRRRHFDRRGSAESAEDRYCKDRYMADNWRVEPSIWPSGLKPKRSLARFSPQLEAQRWYRVSRPAHQRGRSFKGIEHPLVAHVLIAGE
jgi:hypothetical protein